jgi:hypothetical protein
MHNLPLLEIQQAATQPDHALYDPETRAALAASRLYWRAYFWGGMRRAWSALIRHPQDLLKLSEVKAITAIHNGYSAGVQVVPIRQIRGSEGRSSDFDQSFPPLHERNRGRWLSIATARLQGAALPPVDEYLQQKGEEYDNPQPNSHNGDGARQNDSSCPSQGSRSAVLH